MTNPKKLDGIGYGSKWTQLRIRKYYRDYLRDLGKIYPVSRGGVLEQRPMTMMLEHLLEEAGKKLVHADLGPGFVHTSDPWCGCSPTWPE